MNGPVALRVGIFGVGSIGQTIATALDAGKIHAQLACLADQETEKAEAFAATLASRPRVVTLHELIQRTDLVVESASQASLLQFVPKALAAGRDMMILSVGGLLGREEWFRQAEEKRCRIYVPSGAIAGLDGIKSASFGRVQSVVLTSRKPVAALRGTKYVIENRVELDALTQDTVIFEGTAEEAARAFHTTSNVAASLRLAVDENAPARVCVVAVPGGTENVHEIRVQGEFGRLAMNVENVPSKANPRTSQLAAFSALATLKNLTGALRVGT